MVPDAAAIARRRHTVTICVRSVIALVAAWIGWGAVVWFGQTLQQISESGVANVFGVLLFFLLQFVPQLLLLLAAVIFHGPLVRWIVPTPLPDHSCPKCNYSLKDLKSPICPECGTSLTAPR